VPQPPPRRTSSSLPTHYRLPSTPTICLSSAWRSWRTAQRAAGGSGLGGNTREFTREGLRAISGWSGYTGLKNPLIKRAVSVQNLYVWGQGVTLRAVHPTVDAAVQKVLKDPTNRTVFGDVEAWMRLETGLQLFANLFFVFFINPSTGHVKIRHDSRSTRSRRSSQTR